jgi:hypothetical protein
MHNTCERAIVLKLIQTVILLYIIRTLVNRVKYQLRIEQSIKLIRPFNKQIKADRESGFLGILAERSVAPFVSPSPAIFRLICCC